MQRHTCKHALSYGVTHGVAFQPGCDFRIVTGSKRKRGRVAKVGGAMSCLRRDTTLVPRVPVMPPDETCQEEILDDDADVSTLFGMPEEAKTAPPMPAAPNVGLGGLGSRAGSGMPEEAKSVRPHGSASPCGPRGPVCTRVTVALVEHSATVQ